MPAHTACEIFPTISPTSVGFSSTDGLDRWILVGSKMDKFFFYFCVAIVLSVLTIVSSNELVLDSHADDTLNDLVKRFHSWKVSIQA